MTRPRLGKKICKKAGFTPHQFCSSFVSFLCDEAKRLRLPAFVKKNSTSGIGGGFTLVELLISVFLVSVGLVGVLSFFNSSLQSNFDAKNELVAAGLVQEGTELARNIIDYNYLNDDSWWKSLVVDSIASNSNCKSIDYSSVSSHDCITADETQVCLDGDSRYLQGNSSCTGMTLTDYARTLDVAGQETNGAPGIDLENGDCLKTTSSITWNNRTTTAVDIICKPRQ